MSTSVRGMLLRLWKGGASFAAAWRRPRRRDMPRLHPAAAGPHERPPDARLVAIDQAALESCGSPSRHRRAMRALGGAGGYWAPPPSSSRLVRASRRRHRGRHGGGRSASAGGARGGAQCLRLRGRAPPRHGRSKVTGRIGEVLFEEGAAVRKDQLLARLDAATSQAEAWSPFASLEAARRNLRRSRSASPRRGGRCSAIATCANAGWSSRRRWMRREAESQALRGATLGRRRRQGCRRGPRRAAPASPRRHDHPRAVRRRRSPPRTRSPAR